MDQPTSVPGRAGTVAIVGRPNVGKSTLLNAIVGEKLAIVSPKPQTTRTRILGVWNGDGGQLVFVDTPGVHTARGPLNRFMVDQALGTLTTVDAVLLVVEAETGLTVPRGAPSPAVDAERRLLEIIAESKRPAVLAINKVDRVKPKDRLFPLLEAWHATQLFTALVPVCATRGQGVPGVTRELLSRVPEGPPLYDPDTLTDRTERFLVAELVREQLFHLLHQELPYSTAVDVDQWDERTDRGDVVVDATIYVERESQKLIVVGKGGAMIKDIGARARVEASKLLGRPVHLRLFVKVAPDWTESEQAIARLGYRPEEGETRE